MQPDWGARRDAYSLCSYSQKLPHSQHLDVASEALGWLPCRLLAANGPNVE
jgi:hypothetical protein